MRSLLTESICLRAALTALPWISPSAVRISSSPRTRGALLVTASSRDPSKKTCTASSARSRTSAMGRSARMAWPSRTKKTSVGLV